MDREMRSKRISFIAVIIVVFCLSSGIERDFFAATKEEIAGTATGLNLEVPIEMGMIPSGSQAGGSHDFNRTKVRLNDADYDGSPLWYFEIIAQNTDTADKTVTLKADSSIKATITVPANTPSPVRLRTGPFTPNTGWALYCLNLPATTSDYQLVVWARRIIIEQRNATKTRIQIPLFGRPANPHLYNWAIYNEGPPAWPRITSNVGSGVWEELGHSRRWKKQAEKYADLAPGACWTLEAIMQVVKEGSLANYCTLWNETTNQQVSASEVSNTNSTYTLHYADFPDDATGFTDGNEFGVRTKGHSSNPPRFASAVLYVKLINLKKAQILYTIGYENVVYGRAEGFNGYSRAFIDVSKYSFPIFYFESFGSCGDDQSVLFLRDGGTNSAGTAGEDVRGTGINFDSKQLVRRRTEAIILTGTKNYFVHVLNSPHDKICRTIWLVIDICGAAQHGM